MTNKFIELNGSHKIDRESDTALLNVVDNSVSIGDKLKYAVVGKVWFEVFDIDGNTLLCRFFNEHNKGEFKPEYKFNTLKDGTKLYID